MEPLFPYGDWRWGLLLGLCLVPGAIMYRRAIWRFLRALFGNASATPALAQGIAGHAEEAEESAANPGNGRRMVRRIMAASTVNEVDDLYDDFKIAPRRTKEGEVFAAFALKKARLLGTQNDESWWRSLLESADMDDHLENIFSALGQLQEEYPEAKKGRKQ